MSAGPFPLDELEFDNRFTRQLPADPVESSVGEPVRRRQVEGACFSRVSPTEVASPHTLAWSDEMAEQLGLDAATLQSQDFADVFAGNRLPAGADPFAMCYGGHQFGNWAGQLGDGRAIALGEVIDVDGHHQTLQLKGAGPTPYSRTADGRAVLRSSVREFLCSEAMFHLGVPTTRALSLVATGDKVVRDMFYDGRPEAEPGAVVCRVAPSFVRFGNFQIHAARNELSVLGQLIDFTILNDFPHLVGGGRPIDNTVIAEWFAEVCTRTAHLIVDWQRVGFVHGVMNTDNMSILGLTIDYGPYGWLEDFDPEWTPNTTDAGTRRYRYGQQHQVAHWNLLQLANALFPVTQDAAPLEAALNGYTETYRRGSEAMTADRLGLARFDAGTDEALMTDLVTVLRSTETDYVIFHRRLADVSIDPAVSDDDLVAPIEPAFYQATEMVGEVRQGLVSWLRSWQARVGRDDRPDDERRHQMDAVNPRYVLRNWLAQQAIDASEAGDPSKIHELVEVLRHPYTDQPGRDGYDQRRPEWARVKPGCSMLSCSS
ncbi:MAG: YdiU family protein [Actinomycetia bacterium]|nr:YdiU family protein [Actinomycetes bacterium]